MVIGVDLDAPVISGHYEPVHGLPVEVASLDDRYRGPVRLGALQAPQDNWLISSKLDAPDASVPQAIANDGAIPVRLLLSQ